MDIKTKVSQMDAMVSQGDIVNGTLSASEFTFDFDMKDGSKIYWHEIIRRKWDHEGKVIAEQYFEAN